MLQTNLSTKTRKDPPKDEISKNAQLLTRAGYINKAMSGVYEFLPLGLRSINKIMEVIREEMNSIGGQELFMSSLQSPSMWKESGRWSGEAEKVWFKSELKAGGEVGFGWTHEEPITEMMRQHISSHKDLPVFLYQMQTKFRNELRAKSGIMRTREFIMKDLYSFVRNEEEHKKFYEICAQAYMKIFKRVGLEDYAYRTYASGGLFSKFSDEFQAVCDAGEDTIYISKEKNIALNKEVYTDEVVESLGLSKKDLVECQSAEIGNIFTLGTKFSSTLGLMYKDEDGKEHPVYMGSYGIGPARLLGVIVELFGTDNEMILPEQVSPYRVHLLSLSEGEQAEKLYKELTAKGVEVLFDDRNVSAGEKFADSDLIGIPHRLILSQKSVESGGVECTDRKTGKTDYLSIENTIKHYA